MESCFLVDINVARLATWLRVLGYDAALGATVDDRGLVRQALAQGRILLTRDRRLARQGPAIRGLVKVLLVHHDDIWKQLRQVVQELGLDLHRQSFTRCIRCNVLLELIPREQVQERVPPFVYRTQAEFSWCSACRRVYWPGTHWRNMRAELARVTEEQAPTSS